MTVLVTGGSGFIGRRLVSRLLDRGQEVRILTRDPERLPPAWRGRVQVAVGDLVRPATLLAAVAGAGTVYHLAAEIRDESQVWAANVAGTQNLLAALAGAGPRRFVHLSSVGVMGARRPGCVDESAPCRPRGAYEESKYAAEQLALAAGDEGRLAVSVLRPAIVFGERPPAEYGSFEAWLGAIRAGRFRLIGRGDSVANYIYVEDVAQACLLLASAEQAAGQVYIVSDSCPLAEFVGLAAQRLGVPPPGRLPRWAAYTLAAGLQAVAAVGRFSPPLTTSRVRALTSQVWYSSDKLRRELDYRPEVGWRQGLARTIDSYREQH